MSYILRGEVILLDMALRTRLVFISVPSVYKMLANSILKTPSPRDSCILYLKANKRVSIEFREEITNFLKISLTIRKALSRGRIFSLFSILSLESIACTYSGIIWYLKATWAVYMQCSWSVSLNSVTPPIPTFQSEGLVPEHFDYKIRPFCLYEFLRKKNKRWKKTIIT